MVFFFKWNDKLSFYDFSSPDAGCADICSFDSASQDNFDPLEVGHDFAQGFTDDFRTGAAFALDHTASAVLVSGRGAFIAQRTYF